MTDGRSPLFPDPVEPTEERQFAPPKSKRTAKPDATEPVSSTSGAPEHAPAKRSFRQRILVGSGVMVVLALVAAAVVVGYGWWRWSQVGRADLALAAETGGPQNFLIVGSDSRAVVDADEADADGLLGTDDDETSGQRSDTIMLVRVDPEAHTVDMVSFPRDLWVEIPGTDGHERINTAYALDGGPQRLVDTIKANFDIDVNHYVEVDFRSFKGVVDAVGGVPMYFDRKMRDTSSGLVIDNPGCVTLDGEQALAFSRARHLKYFDTNRGMWVDDPTADLGRISRQQEFIRKMLDRAAAATKGFDLKAVNDIVGSTADNVTIDSGLELADFMGLAKEFRSFSGDQIRTYSLPVEPYSTAGGAAVLKMERSAAQPVLNVFRGLPPGDVQPVPEDITLSIQNGSGLAGQAGVAREDLASIGFEVAGTGDATANGPRTEVRYAPGSALAANQVLAHLSAGGTLTRDARLEPGEIVLVTGTDFTGVSEDALDVAPVEGDAWATSTTSTTADPNVISESIGVVPGDPVDGTVCA